MDVRFSSRRSDYPGAENWTYFDVSARGLISRGVRAAIDAYLDHRMTEGGNKEWMFSVVEETRGRFADLIGAARDEISITKNVSDSINAFAAALPWRPGDNVVVCQALEHPANIFPWQNLARQRGIVVKTVQPEAGRVPVDQLTRAIDGNTRVVTVSTVSFAPGFIFPVVEMARLCRSRGVLLIVDAAQSVGVLHTDVTELGVDALVASTQKGLLALYGLGFLYVRRDLAEILSPAYLSRPGVRISAEHEAAAGDVAHYDLAVAARRFDVGNFNYVGVIAVHRAMEEIASLGTRAIEARVCGLAQRLAEELSETGLPVFGGTGCRDRRHIVAIGHALTEEHDATNDAMLLELHDHFMAARIRHTIRCGMLRLSLHLYNNEDDVGTAVAAARAFMRRQARPAEMPNAPGRL
jgi:selenocysteine lyase/cysteine desulfurase